MQIGLALILKSEDVHEKEILAGQYAAEIKFSATLCIDQVASMVCVDLVHLDPNCITLSHCCLPLISAFLPSTTKNRQVARNSCNDTFHY